MGDDGAAPTGCSRIFMIAAPILSFLAFIVTCFFNWLANADAEDLEWGKA